MRTAASSTREANAVGRGQGEAIWFNGALMSVKSPGSWSEDAFSLVEVAMERGRATGLHTDPGEETFYVLEGELLFHVDGAERRASVGDTVGIPRGVPHAFVAVSDLARFLVLNAPGTHDRFFRAGGFPASDRDFASAPPPDLERTRAAAEQVGVQLLGPAPFDEVRLQSG
jgi:quercetin dioxygenase-like cupin family protein